VDRIFLPIFSLHNVHITWLYWPSHMKKHLLYFLPALLTALTACDLLDEDGASKENDTCQAITVEGASSGICAILKISTERTSPEYEYTQFQLVPTPDDESNYTDISARVSLANGLEEGTHSFKEAHITGTGFNYSHCLDCHVTISRRSGDIVDGTLVLKVSSSASTPQNFRRISHSFEGIRLNN
jgi:hypothetical protein